MTWKPALAIASHTDLTRPPLPPDQRRGRRNGKQLSKRPGNPRSQFFFALQANVRETVDIIDAENTLASIHNAEFGGRKRRWWLRERKVIARRHTCTMAASRHTHAHTHTHTQSPTPHTHTQFFSIRPTQDTSGRQPWWSRTEEPSSST